MKTEYQMKTCWCGGMTKGRIHFTHILKKSFDPEPLGVNMLGALMI